MAVSKSRQEYEIKVLDVDVKEVRNRLKALGARKIRHIHYTRLVFPLWHTAEEHGWIRLRTDGKITTLTLKENRGKAISGTKEYEVKVDDFRETARILCKAFPNGTYEENLRELYALDGAEITIDSWPDIPPYVEIEGSSPKHVMKLYKKLDIKGLYFGNRTTGVVYDHYGLDWEKIFIERNAKKLSALISE